MRTILKAAPLAGLAAVLAGICGCTGNGMLGDDCNGSLVVAVNPSSATVNHAAAPPANQVQFIADEGYAAPAGGHCAVSAIAKIVPGTWANPDPQDIQISSANNSTNGTAVCLSPTNGAVTLTGTFSTTVVASQPQSSTQSVQLTCE
jgi:hypothetical protein